MPSAAEIQFAEYLEKKKQDSGNVTYIYSDKHVAARNKKKLRTLKRLAKSIAKLRKKVTDDLDSPEKGEVAMVVALIDETYERVGNPGSAAENHFGVTTWRKKHVSFPGSKAVIKYKGKGGIGQEKTVTSKRIVNLLKGLVAEKKAEDELFPGVASGAVNAYLKPFSITAKDIRGFHANEEMKKALGKVKKKGGDEKQRKEEFKKALEETAKNVGHDPGTLKKDYLVPSFEENYLEHGRIGANSADGALRENRYMSRVAGHLGRMLAIRKFAKKDKKKQWETDSAMLAIMAPPGVVRKLRKFVDSDTVSPDGLHMTLLFLGKVADLDDATMRAIQRAAEKVCARHQPLAMRVSGAGMFAPGEDGTPVYVVPNAKGLSTLQADLENVVGSIIDLPSEHGWVPHMTIAYSCDDRPSPPELKAYPEWTAKTVRLQAGGKAVADFPLGRKKKAEADFPLSRRAAEEDDPFYNPPPPGEEDKPDPWKKYEDPVKHMREDNPTYILPHNIPDMQVVWAEGLEGQQEIPLDESLDESDPGGKYVVQDIGDRELGRYETEEKAVANAEKSGWSWRVIFIGPFDDVDTAIVEDPSKVSIPWSRSREHVRRLIEETLGGPYYLKDYWGRTVASFSDREKAIENAERNMYISHVVGSLDNDPDRGETIWEKPKAKATGTQMAMDVLPIAADPVLWSDEQLAEVVKTPHLMEQLEQKPELLKAVMEQVAKRKGAHEALTPKDIGKWRERGWFLLHIWGSPLGWYGSREEAGMSRDKLIDMFAEGEPFEHGSPSIGAFQLHRLVARRLAPGEWPMGEDLTPEQEQAEKDAIPGVEQAADELRKHPFYKEKRRRLAEKAYGVTKAPQDFTPSKAAVVSGALPTRDNGEAAGWQIKKDNSQGKYELEFDLDKAGKESHEATDEFHEDAARNLERRARMRREGLDPDKLADDMPLSQRAMDKLPIAADPVLWTDEQLAEVVKTPHLMKQLQGNSDLLKAVMEQIAKRKGAQERLEGLELKDIGKWMEHGWFLLYAPRKPLGFFRNRHEAAMAADRLIGEFAEGSLDWPQPKGASHYQESAFIDFVGEMGDLFRDAFPDDFPVEHPDDEDAASTAAYQTLRKEEGANDKLKELMLHPFYAEKREKYARKALKVSKAPPDFTPSKEAVVTEGRPTAENIDKAEREAWNSMGFDEVWPKDRGDEDKEFVEDTANAVIRRKKMRQEGIDPDKMSDDMPRVAGFIGRMIRLAERLDDSGDHDGAECLCRQMDFLISRRAHFVPSEKTEAPPMWRKNLDYGGEESPWRGNLKEFLDKHPDGLAGYIKERRKSRKKRERQWKLAQIAGRPLMSARMRGAIDDDMADALPGTQRRMSEVLRIAQQMDEEEEMLDAKDDYIKDPLKAPKEFVKYWSLLLKKTRGKRRKRKGK